jgi:hypothetical protein
MKRAEFEVEDATLVIHTHKFTKVVEIPEKMFEHNKHISTVPEADVSILMIIGIFCIFSILKLKSNKNDR